MLAEALIQNAGNQSDASCPLPLPEYLTGYGLAQCLVAAAPMIAEARKGVLQGAVDLARSYQNAPFDPANIEQSLAADLPVSLMQMMGQVTVLELNVARLEGVLAGETPEERFASFVDRLRRPELARQLFAEYPVLSEQIARRLRQWSDFSLEFLKHLCEDWASVKPLVSDGDPGPLVEIQGGAGDTHRNGRSVMIASFAGGGRVVYKPRSLAADVHFQELLGWLNDRGAQPHFRQMKLVDGRDHGWVEFIPAAPCATEAELARFYQRQGGYLATLHAIQACDFFCENLIAAGEHPMLIDLEALFHPRLDQAQSEQVDEIAVAAMCSSVLRTGLLPMRMWAAKDRSGIDISGLADSAGQLSPSPVPQWERANTDEMHLVRKRVEMDGARNCPTLNGDSVNAADYADAVAGGFASTYRLLLAHRSEFLGLLRRFSGDEVRVIVRPTQTYGTLLHESFHPDVLRVNGDRLELFDRLRSAAFRHPALDALLSAERSDLLRGDIPLFTTRPESRDLVTSDGGVIENFFAESGMTLAERRILQLGANDLERQLWTIRASLATLASTKDTRNPPAGVAPVARTNRENFLSAAVAIGDRLGELAYCEHAAATWIGIAVAGENDCQLLPLGADFYDGLPGVILFLAQLGAISGEFRYTALAGEALQTLRRQMELFRQAGPLGAFSGWGGIIYLLAHLGGIWNDPSLLTEAEELCDRLQPAIEHDRTYDVIGGAAGCVLALLALYRCRPRAATLETARQCGRHLLRSAQPMETGIGWLCGENAEHALTGFAHGNAGIAYALTTLAYVTGERYFAEAASQAVAYERSLYSPEHRNWPDLRQTATAEFATAWCHGAPGIALSRLGSLGRSDDSSLEEIDAALETTVDQHSYGNHTLCHGDLGNADILLEASITLGDGRWRAHAEQMAAAVMESAAAGGWICANSLRVESPGLMTGLAGIGYTFLRLAYPARVPSVLALQPPVMI